MEKRYDLSFMKEYAKLYHKDNRWLAEKFHCGVKIVDKILTGEIRIKEKPMEDILYEFSYKDYNSFKEDIIKKTNEMKRTNEIRKNNEIKKELEKQKYNEMKKINEIQKEVEIKKEENTINYEIEINPIYENRINNYKIKLNDYANCDTNPSDIFDYNSMKNIDRVIVALLCDEETAYSIKQISKFLHVDEEYIKNVYLNILNCIKKANKIESKNEKTKA